MLALLLLAAPLPFARPAAPPPPIGPGRWVQRWGRWDYPTVLRADGTCEAGCYRGRWRAEGRTLCVRESLEGGPVVWWRAELDARGEGDAVDIATGAVLSRVGMERLRE